jgi:hypothetical protein
MRNKGGRQMKVMETQFDGGKSMRTVCDFCDEEPENGVLIEKPHSMIVKGQRIVSHRPQALYICLDCLQMEIENI